MLYSKLIKNVFYNYFFTSLILLFYLSEGVSKYYLYYYSYKLNSPKNIKSATIILLSFYLIYQKKTKIIIKLLLLLSLFIVGQLSLGYSILNVEKMTIISKYLFSIFFLETAYLFFKKKGRLFFFKIFESIIILNSILLILGFVFDIKLFKTYTNRFGFNGLFITSATSTYFYIIAIFYLFIKRNKSKNFYFLGVLTIISALLVGTKSILLFIILLIIYISIFKIDKQKRFTSILSAIIISVFIVFYFLLSESTFIKIFSEKGLLTSILSYRDFLLKERTIPYINNNWSFINYFLGGINNTMNRSQLGFIDLFLTFGLIGSIIYLITYFKSLIRVKVNKDITFFLVSLGIIIALGGNFFFSATIIIYLVVIQQILIHIQNE